MDKFPRDNATPQVAKNPEKILLSHIPTNKNQILMKKVLTTMLLCLMVTVTAWAQTKATGLVTSSEDGLPVVGASIKVLGTKAGTITDANGRYSVEISDEKSKLEISYIGMLSKTIQAGKNVHTALEVDAAGLDEVVVVAYGTQKRTSLTGAIQSVKSEDIALRPTSSAASALEGTVAGVQVNSTYGAPGSDPDIRIRGVGTVNGSSSPLYVLDGVPFGGNVSDINPADIESISVLKDAASAALYGNRASNGVILINTKKGKMGKLNVSLDIKQGSYNKGIPEYDRADARQWMELEWQNLRNSRMYSNGEDAATSAAYASANVVNEMTYLNIFNKPDDQLFTSDGRMVSDAQILSGYLDDLDWYDQAVRSGYRQEYNINANGANDKADYRFSVGYLNENGYLKDSGFERLAGSMAVNVQPVSWFKTGLQMNGSHQNFNNTNGSSDASYTNVFMYCRNIAPIYPVHLHDVNTGEYILDSFGNKQYDPGSYEDAEGNIIPTRNQYVDRHVMWENELNYDRTVRNTLNATAYATFTLPYGFSATVKANINTRNSRNHTYNSAVIGDGKGSDGRAKREEYSYKNYTFQQQLEWAHDYGKHSVDALVGHENYSYEYNYLYGYKTSEIVAGWGNFTNFTSITSLDGSDAKYRTESYLGRVRYAYDDRYNVEASFRRDGSSRFAKDARWGNFWSLGANWIISKESFMQEYKWVNYLKLRADYGEVGNDAGAGYYASKALYTVEQNSNQGAFYLTQFPNTNLKWETGQSWGIGIDARLFNRWNLSLEYFDKRNKDLLFDVYLPISSGATSSSSAESVVTQNLGTISNRGFEISTDVDVYKNKDLKINIGANLTYLKNKIVTLPEQNKDGIVEGTKYIVEGKSRYEFFVYTFEGVDSKNGYSLYKFNDGDAQGKSYRFTLDGVQYGNWEQKLNEATGEMEYVATEITGDNLNNITIIDGVPYSYVTNYAKKEFHGSSIPPVYGSFNIGVTWKQLSFGALFTYQLGGKVIDYNYQSLMTAGSSPSSFHADALNSWTAEDATAESAIWTGDIPVLNYNLSSQVNTTSSRWLTSASYICLKNLNIAYELPKRWVSKLELQGVGISLTCENLFTKTARKGMNPQQTFNGTQYNYLVTPRVFSFGLNVRF